MWAVWFKPPFPRFAFSQFTDTISDVIRHRANEVLEGIKLILNIRSDRDSGSGVIKRHGNIQVQAISVNEQGARKANVRTDFGPLGVFELQDLYSRRFSGRLGSDSHVFELTNSQSGVESSGQKSGARRIRCNPVCAKASE